MGRKPSIHSKTTEANNLIFKGYEKDNYASMLSKDEISAMSTE